MQRCLLGVRPCVRAGLRTQGTAYLYRNNTNAVKQLYRSLSVALVAPERHLAERVRNVAIIAHVDHGKTTLVDKLMRDTQGVESETDRLMDSMSLEKERGITIMSKYCRVDVKDHVLNIVDTPGHSDFGGEVERVLSMVDGVVLVVDGTEGPMSQTKFVLSKAIERKLKPVVVINKVDRPTARIVEVENEIFDLFCALEADDDQLEYPLIYASAKEGWATREWQGKAPENGNMEVLLSTIIDTIPPPYTAEAAEKAQAQPFKMEVNSIQTDTYVGRVVMGKVHTGRVSVGDPIKAMSREGTLLGEGKVSKLYCQRGMDKRELADAGPGDILWLAGVEAGVSDTIASPDATEPLPTRMVDPPTLSMTFGANDSPLSGKEGKFVTGNHVKARLYKELENNVSILVKPAPDPEAVEVHGRGELQLGILVEQMRREGYELCVSPPKVLTRKCPETGKEQEPVEEVTIDVEPQYSGVCVEKMSGRKGQLLEFKDHRDKSRLVFRIPSRGMLGFMTEIRTETRGSAVVNRVFSGYEASAGHIESLFRGKLVSMEQGQATGYALNMIEDRGVLFIEPGTEVYTGMVVGEHNRPVDLDINPCKGKKLSNVRSVNAEEAIRLSPPILRSLEELISYMGQDEMLEVTPTKLRLRKRVLDPGLRARIAKAGKK